MGSYIINAKFPIYTFFNFDEIIFSSFSHLENSRPMIFKNKIVKEATNTEKQIFQLTNLEIFNSNKSRSIKAVKDIEQSLIKEKKRLIKNLLKNQKTSYSKKHILEVISKKHTKSLFLYFITNHFLIISSKIEQFSNEELNEFKSKFLNINKFKNAINSRINLSKLDEYIESIKQSDFIIDFDQILFINSILRFLNKNAFIELSESIYSIKTKDRYSYFDLEKIFGEINRYKFKPKHTSGTNLLNDLKKSFKSINDIDFNNRVSEIELYTNKKSREKLLFDIFIELVKFDKSASKADKSIIFFNFFKLIAVPLFFKNHIGKTDKELKEKFRYYRRDYLKIKLTSL